MLWHLCREIVVGRNGSLDKSSIQPPRTRAACSLLMICTFSQRLRASAERALVCAEVGSEDQALYDDLFLHSLLLRQ